MKLEVRNLTKNFGEKEVLKGISFTAEAGSATGLLGRNGAGKTTAIRMIMGVFGGGGEILADGAPIRRDKINIGYLPEERGLYPKKPIAEQMVYFACLRGMKTRDAKAAVKKWLARLEMEEYADKKLDTLSKGNQQKIQLATALLSDPELIILDEPFSGLDPVNAMLLKDVVTEQINIGKTVLFSSHQMNYVEEFCRTIAILNQGKIVLNGNLSEIKRGYDRRKILLRTQNAEALAAALQNLPDGIAAHIDTAPNLVTVQLQKAEDKKALAAFLGTCSADFDSMAVYEPSLNDIFVEYTED